MRNCLLFITILSIALASCRKAFEPIVLTQNNNLLVVEGAINTAPAGITTIKLSRTRKLNDSVLLSPETNAVVSIQSESGEFYFLLHTGNGIYKSQALNLNPSRRHRLSVNVGDQYESEYLSSVNNPPIDSVSWERNEDIFLFVNTRDPSNNTRYFRWEYEETYEYTALYNAIWGLNGNRIFLHDSTTQTYVCWKTSPSSDILIASTQQLAQSVVSRMPLTSIRKNSEPLYYKYSILVRQYALSQEAFQFWQILKKNTQELGTLFDPQPSQLKTNLRCVSNPSQAVIGFVSACPVREQRIFIRNADVPGWPGSPSNFNCEVLIRTANPVDYTIWDYGPPYVPYYFITGGGLAITPASCVDCTLRNGVNRKPAFW